MVLAMPWVSASVVASAGSDGGLARSEQGLAWLQQSADGKPMGSFMVGGFRAPASFPPAPGPKDHVREFARFAGSAMSGVGFLREFLQQSEKSLRLADEQSHVGEELHHPLGDVFRFGGPYYRARWQLPADERAWFGHDQVGLKILATKRRSIQVWKCNRDSGHWVYRGQRRRITCLIRPGLKVHGFGGPDADQDTQNFRMICALRQ